MAAKKSPAKKKTVKKGLAAISAPVKQREIVKRGTRRR